MDGKRAVRKGRSDGGIGTSERFFAARLKFAGQTVEGRGTGAVVASARRNNR